MAGLPQRADSIVTAKKVGYAPIADIGQAVRCGLCADGSESRKPGLSRAGLRLLQRFAAAGLCDARFEREARAPHCDGASTGASAGAAGLGCGGAVSFGCGFGLGAGLTGA